MTDSLLSYLIRPRERRLYPRLGILRALTPSQTVLLNDFAIDRVVSDEASRVRELNFVCVTNVDRCVDVKSAFYTAARPNSRTDTNVVCVDVFVVVRTFSNRSELELTRVALEEVSRAVLSSDTVVEAHVTAEVEARDRELPSSWDVEVEREVTVLTAFEWRDLRTNLSCELRESHCESLFVFRDVDDSSRLVRATCSFERYVFDKDRLSWNGQWAGSKSCCAGEHCERSKNLEG